MTDRARELRKNMTDAESLLWTHLREKQLAGIKFRRQQPIGQYIVDFVSLDHNLIIEVDGGQHVEDVDYDRSRTDWLESQGFNVIRFWNDDVLTNTEQVLDDILRHLE